MAATLERDTELMLRVRDGCSSSFALLLERNRGPLVHFLYRMVQSQAVAEELAQETFLRVYKSRGSYEPTAKFSTWLFRIATHLAINHLRDTKNEKAASLDEDREDGTALQVRDDSPNVEQRLAVSQKAAEIRSAVAALPEKQRAAVLMHKYQEMDYKQIAGVLGCSESAVKSILWRAYETLRARLAHYAS
ncbi:MAG: sigma-70 family RNA polymerase sigma factor [Bryobacteraceae bacterium]|nr:sigma-70 family RNA polymerase sigma factor [Bryobacteraceae bacterium]